MSLRISGKNMDIGDSFRSHIETGLEEALAKYFSGGYDGHVTVSKDGSGFTSEGTVNLDTGMMLQATGKSQDARSSFDISLQHLEKRLRRYKRRLKDHHAKSAQHSSVYVLKSPDEDELDEDYNPAIIAESTTSLKSFSLDQAVVELDLSQTDVLVFRNAGNGEINVVHRRQDGNIGWIDPSLHLEEKAS
jgi:ribosomal subunit interface protein